MTETLDDLSAVVKSKVEKLAEKLCKAKFIMENIKELKNSSMFLSQQDMEILAENSSKRVQVAIAIQASIKALKDDKDFLSIEDIEKMTSLIGSAKTKLYIKEDSSL